MANLLKIKEYITEGLNAAGQKTLSLHSADFNMRAFSISADSISEEKESVDRDAFLRKAGKKIIAERGKKVMDENLSPGGTGIVESYEHKSFPLEVDNTTPGHHMAKVHDHLKKKGLEVGKDYFIKSRHPSWIKGNFMDHDTMGFLASHGVHEIEESINEEYEGHIHALRSLIDSGRLDNHNPKTKYSANAALHYLIHAKASHDIGAPDIEKVHYNIAQKHLANLSKELSRSGVEKHVASQVTEGQYCSRCGGKMSAGKHGPGKCKPRMKK